MHEVVEAVASMAWYGTTLTIMLILFFTGPKRDMFILLEKNTLPSFSNRR